MNLSHLSRISLLSLLVLGQTGCDDKSKKNSHTINSIFLLKVNPDTIDMGMVHAGDVKKSTFTILNTSDKPVELESVDISCPCVRIMPIPIWLEGHETAEVTLLFDSREEPEFRGGLAVTLEGKNKTNEKLFETVVKVVVESIRPQVKR